MEITANSTVRIDCNASVYNGLVGSVHEVQPTSKYAIVLLPEGTEERVEGIVDNVIRLQRRKAKVPLPPGDPQWFPLEWLVVIDGAPAKDISDVKGPTPKTKRSRPKEKGTRPQKKRQSPKRTRKPANPKLPSPPTLGEGKIAGFSMSEPS
jgi:hypothetical protein